MGRRTSLNRVTLDGKITEGREGTVIARRTAAVTVLALALSTLVSVTAPRAVAAAPGRQASVTAAAQYAESLGYHVGISVIDTQTGDYYGAGDDTGLFASESVIKAMIATKLLATGQMHGEIETMAWKMITQSDNATAWDLYFHHVGGSGLINWIKHYYGLWGLGTRPMYPEHFGNNHLTAHGLVHFYAHVKADPKVGPWLINAMRHATAYSSDAPLDPTIAADSPAEDGDYQYWGIPSAASDWAVKQGWGTEGDDLGRYYYHLNSTGFSTSQRYAIAILARGPVGHIDAMRAMMTATAQRLLPEGQFPDPPPYVTHLGKTAGRTAAGNTITVYGLNFDHVRQVYFGTLAAPSFRVVSPGVIKAVVPRHDGGEVNVSVRTEYGTSSNHPNAHYRFVPVPQVVGLSATLGVPAGGPTLTLTGYNFRHVARVWFGTTPASDVTVVSTRELSVVVPPHDAGMVNVAVSTWYGDSPHVLADQYRYVPPPNVHSLSPDDGDTSGGTAVTVTGSNFRGDDIAVRFGDTAASSVTVLSTTQLRAVAPAHDAGTVAVRVVTAFGVSATGASYLYR